MVDCQNILRVIQLIRLGLLGGISNNTSHPFI